MHLDRWIDDHRVPTRLAVWLGALVFITLLGLCVHRADAADASLTWTHPTQRTDNSALALADIKETEIQYAPCAAGNTWPATGTPASKVVTAPAAATTITGLAYGTWCFRARTVPVLNPATDQSAWTGPVWAIYLAPPKPPVLGVVNIVAYDVRWQQGGGTKLARAIGTVPLGTTCGDHPITRRGTRSYYEVPLDKVDLRSLPNSAIVVAECEVKT